MLCAVIRQGDYAYALPSQLEVVPPWDVWFDYKWAITGWREGMAQTTANLDWLQNMDKRAWNGLEWAVEIHTNLSSESRPYTP